MHRKPVVYSVILFSTAILSRAGYLSRIRANGGADARGSAVSRRHATIEAESTPLLDITADTADRIGATVMHARTCIATHPSKYVDSPEMIEFFISGSRYRDGYRVSLIKRSGWRQRGATSPAKYTRGCGSRETYEQTTSSRRQ